MHPPLPEYDEGYIDLFYKNFERNMSLLLFLKISISLRPLRPIFSTSDKFELKK